MANTLKKNYFYDIFDTILSRKVEPEYVKKIWATNIVKILNLDISSFDLYGYRSRIEIELGKESLNKGYDCEITYKDIIKQLYKSLKINMSFNSFYSICEKEEIDIESNVLFVNDDILSQIKKYKKEKCKIYCISDMYLSKKMIEKIFNNLNILSYFDDIFISCEYLLNKGSGKLYDVVINKLKVDPSSCVMCGDNKEKDYLIPKNKGFSVEHIDRLNTYKFYEDFIKNNNPLEVPNKLLDMSKNSDKIFNNLIYSLYNYIDKIYFKLKELGFSEVFFLAREGEFLKKLFDYYVENKYNEKIKSHYLYVSRKATYLPSLKSIDVEDFSYLLNQYECMSPLEFLNSLNFCVEDIDAIKLDINNISFDTKILKFKNSKEIKMIKKSKVFRKIYEKNRSEQNKLFKKYIKQFTSSNRIMVIDIGWNGSIQDNIQKILGDDYTVYGSYFGLCLRDKKYSGKKYGLIYSNDPEENKQFRLYYENRTIYEILCGASHGSANRYILNNNKKVEVSLFSKKEERQIYDKLVKPAQDDMFTTYKSIVELLNNSYYDNIQIEKKFNYIQFLLLYKPNISQLELFNKIYHYENFGAFGFTTFSSNKISFKRWIKENIKFFIRYGTYFNDAFWPVLKLYNYNLKIPYMVYYNRRKRRYKKSCLF